MHSVRLIVFRRSRSSYKNMKLTNTVLVLSLTLSSVTATQAKIVTEKGPNGYSVTRVVDDVSTVCRISVKTNKKITKDYFHSGP
jgi:hypothetical protein